MLEYDAARRDDLDDDESSSLSGWGLNFVLGLLGATVLGLAFITLDRDEPGYLYNPWTYAVIVPVTLVMLSALLSTVVSRVVRRSMQVAFLFSVLAHLLILTYFNNIVIHSRLWPQLFDSFAQQRQKLKLEQLQAKDYVKVSASTQPKRRPDHMRPVPTQYQPIELPPAEDRKMHLAKSEVSQLVRPLAESEKAATPHRLKRMESQLPGTSNNNEASATELMAASIIPRSSSETKQPLRSQPIIAPSSGSNELLAEPSLAARVTGSELMAAEEQVLRRSNMPDSSNRLREFNLPEAAGPTVIAASPLRRNQNELQIPNPSDGVSTATLARSSAGGVTGPGSRSSLPVLGSELLSSQSNSGDELRAGSEAIRRSARSNQAAALPQLSQSGSLASPQWNGSAKFATGTASRSPSQLALEGSGEANSSDVAALYGAGGEIRRAAVGTAGPQGQMPTTTAPSGFSASEEPLELRASVGEVRRSSADKEVIPGVLPDEILAQVSEDSSGSVAANQRRPAGIQRKESSSDSTNMFSPSDPTSLERSREVAAGAPKTGRIDTRNIALGGDDDAVGTLLPGSLDDIQRSRSAGRTEKMPIPLQIDAGSGLGGLDLLATDARPTLPRRSLEPLRLSLPEFNVQKLTRSEVGSLLGGGTNVALPTPAFQQRLNRLENSGFDSSIDPRSELAIERGLEFLTKYQRNDGSWRLQDFDTKVLIRSDTAATGLALLAFQGAGYTHVQSKYATQVGRAIEFLANHQKQNGDLYIPQDPASDQNGWLYSHAIASLALCEAYGMTQDERLKSVAQRAIDFMVSSQDPARGGWRYRPGTGSDTSVTGWYMMALQSGRLAGLNVPSATFDAIKSFVERAKNSEEEPHIYRYNPFAPDTPEQRHGLQPTAVMTSVGLLIRLYSGWRRDNKSMMEGANYLLIHAPQNGSKRQSRRDTYYWYYATQVIFHMGGDYWKRWQGMLNPMLINEQVSEGRYAGSWDPNEPVPDLWARYGGRLYVTTMNLLSLEVSYRHLPLYESTR